MTPRIDFSAYKGDWDAPSAKIAAELGCCVKLVLREKRRRQGGIPLKKPVVSFDGVDFSRPPSEIARKLGCHPYTVYRELHRRGISLRKSHVDFSAYKGDWNVPGEDIARAVGCDLVTALVERARRLGLKTGTYIGRSGRARVDFSTYKGDWNAPAREIAAAMGCCAATVRKEKRRRGL